MTVIPVTVTGIAPELLYTYLNLFLEPEVSIGATLYPLDPKRPKATMMSIPALLLEENRKFLRLGYLTANPIGLQKLSVFIYRSIAHGNAVSIERICEQLQISANQVHALLNLLPDNAVEYDTVGDIVAFVGLGLVPANHTFMIQGKKLYTWCVLDALFLPAILQANAKLETVCPATARPIDVELSPSGILSSTSPHPVVSLTALEKKTCCQNLRAAFCDHVNLFVDSIAFDKWRGEDSHFTSLPLEDAYLLALERNNWRYPDIDWRRQTSAECRCKASPPEAFLLEHPLSPKSPKYSLCSDSMKIKRRCKHE